MPAETSTETSNVPSRVLIVLLGAIGDVVRALPLLARMRRAWPAAHIAWAVEPKSEPILRTHPWLDEVIVYERKNAAWSFLPFLRRIKDGHFDVVVDLQRHLKSGVIALASRASDRLGFAAANSKEFNHFFSTRRIEPQPNMRLKLMQYQAFGDLLGIPPAPIEFGLAPQRNEAEHAKRLLADAPRPLLGVILGSSWPSRIYFPESIAQTLRELARPLEGSPALYPVLIGGNAETGLAAETMWRLEGIPALNVVGSTSLRDVIAILTECAVAFGPDSGPMHIAAAVGCPVVSLWGSTAPERSAPWGFADFAIRGEIPCHPCYLRECPIGRECMRRIDPLVVAASVRRALTSPVLAAGHPERAADGASRIREERG